MRWACDARGEYINVDGVAYYVMMTIQALTCRMPTLCEWLNYQLFLSEGRQHSLLYALCAASYFFVHIVCHCPAF